MGILLVRHADAVDAGGDIDDAARWLSAPGRDRARKVAAALAARGLTFGRWFASPRVRAVQTAELFAAALGFAGPIEILPALSYTMPATRAREALDGVPGQVAAFGHMPTIGELCGLYVRGAHGHFAAAEAVFVEAGRVQFRLSPDELA